LEVDAGCVDDERMGTRPHVVIVGAGFGGLTAAKHLERADVDVTLIDHHNYHSFQPLLYQVATAGLNPADVGYAVRGVFRRQRRVYFRKAEVTGVDWEAQRLVLRDEAPVAFDHLILAAGSSTNYFGVPGAAEFAFPLYGLEDAVRVRNHLLSLFEAADAVPELIDDGVLNLVIVGGGATGVEVAGAMAEIVDKVLRQDFHDLDVRRTRIILIEQAPHLLAPFGERNRRYARRVLEDRGVEVRLTTAVTSVASDHITLDDGSTIRTRLVLWAAGVRASGLADHLDLPQGRGGRVVVASDLSIPGHPDTYAIGDVADIDDGHGGRLPQLAQVAMQGGTHAAEQILATIEHRPHTDFHYFDKGTMATIGRRAAVAEFPGGFELRGPLAWLAWLGLHLVYLLGVRNRISVFINWAWNYLTWDHGPRLILRPEDLPHTPHPISDLKSESG
jgi:NADH:ubiquinone reductase (H+-translocating)